MLIEYGAKNFFCFKEGVEISFKSPDKTKQASSVLCVKGANASGKTNALKILSFLSDFCENSFSEKPEHLLGFETFFSKSKEAEFFVDFMVDDVFYRYELITTEYKVISEKLARKTNRLTPVVERHEREIIRATGEFKSLKTIKKIRANASIISIAHHHEIDSLEPIYNFFKSIMTNVRYTGQNDSKPDLSKLSKYYHDYKGDLKFAKGLISKFDLGIKDIEIHSRKNDEDKDEFFPIFIHSLDSKEQRMTYHFESSGTKALYNQLFKYKLTLDLGGVLVMDEFDINLHPDILPKLVELFMNESINKNGAQLIFTTHHTDIMDILGKYRTVLVMKKNSESFAYRLDEIPGDLLRKGRPISTVYKAGKVGGVPNFV